MPPLSAFPVAIAPAAVALAPDWTACPIIAALLALNAPCCVAAFWPVALVLQQLQPGDLLVQKAPAATVQVLAEAIRELLNGSSEIKVIGTRHGEKLYESLVSREEMARASDLGGYYRIQSDSRDLNYQKFFVEGETRIAELDDYTSHNTERLDLEGVKKTLMRLPEMQEAVRRNA